MINTIDLIDVEQSNKFDSNKLKDYTIEILEQSNKFDSSLEEDYTIDILEPVELFGDEEPYTNELNYNSIDEFSIGLFDEIY